MHLFKKSIHIIFVISLSFVFWILFYKLFFDFIGYNLNNYIVFKDNYNPSSWKIVIVKVDNKSLDALQKSDLKILNIQKTVFANTIEVLEKSWVKAIWIDIVFANNSSDIEVLNKVLNKYKNIIIAAKMWWNNNNYIERVLPLKNFSTDYWWSIDITTNNNIANQYRPFYIYKNKIIESFGIKIYRKFISDDLGVWKVEDKTYYINPIKKIPLNMNWNNIINFFNEPWKYKSYSLIEILENKVPKSELEWKIVLIWEYGTLIHDSHLSPIDPENNMAWVEFHANFLDSILQNKYIAEQNNTFQNIELLIVLIFFWIIFYILDLKKSIIIFFAFIILISLLSRYLLINKWIILDVFSFMSYSWMTFVVTYSYKFFIVDKNKRYIEHAFSHYLSKDIVDKISVDSNSLKLWWEKRNVTIFFSDIVWFTTISESLGTDKIFALLGEYLSEMTDILIANKWTLDKYIWDAVMWFFNAPIVIENPEYMACITALKQQEKLTELNMKWKKDNMPVINARIWINSWEAMVGNIWSKDRFNYTVIGDHVNLASRLEWVNKEYLTKICVSEDTYNNVKNDFVFRELDTIKVKGKTNWVKIYELVWFKNDEKINYEALNNYENALKLYYEWNYKKAKKIFEENIWDLPSTKMILRCQDAISGKIHVIDWVYEVKNK